MQDFVDMAEAHEWTLRRLREMAGRLTEQAYFKASAAAAGSTPEDDEAHARWMLVFDRMARGLRLSIALEAKLHRERRWDADEIAREAQGERHAPRWRQPGQPPRPPRDREPCEADRERDDDGLGSDAPLSERLGRLTEIIAGGGAEDAPPSRKFVWVEGPEPDVSSDTTGDAQGVCAGDLPWRGSG
jgi:hypothetical protein